MGSALWGVYFCTAAIIRGMGANFFLVERSGNTTLFMLHARHWTQRSCIAAEPTTPLPQHPMIEPLQAAGEIWERSGWIRHRALFRWGLSSFKNMPGEVDSQRIDTAVCGFENGHWPSHRYVAPA